MPSTLKKALHESLGLGRLPTGNRHNLHGFRQDKLTVHSFLGYVADHAVSRKELPEFREGSGSSVTYVVVAVITKGDPCPGA